MDFKALDEDSLVQAIENCAVSNRGSHLADV